MKFSIIAFLSAIQISLCLAQLNNNFTVDKKVNNKIQELRDKKIDTIISSYVNCTGSMMIYKPDTCAAKIPKYLFWVKNGTSYIQRFDECRDYPATTFISQLYKILKKNLTEISKIKLMYTTGKGKNKSFLIIDHYCKTVFEIHIADKLITNDVDDFALENRESGVASNTSYSSNNRSAIVKLKSIVEKEINQYNTFITIKAPN